jgi:GNAT superfamily N-acetyltransferase
MGFLEQEATEGTEIRNPLLTLFAPVHIFNVYDFCYMAAVLHFRRQLLRPPDAAELPGIYVRNFSMTGDVPEWLALRDRAMVDQVPRVRKWSDIDFHSEMTSKSWWSMEHTWVAIAGGLRSPEVVDSGSGPAISPATRRSPAIGPSEREYVVGAVTLAMREGAAGTVPVVHWLLVDPAWRRRGVGRLLVSHLERAVWNDGRREIELETHAGWTAAVAFYHSIGYAPVRDRSPR